MGSTSWRGNPKYKVRLNRMNFIVLDDLKAGKRIEESVALEICSIVRDILSEEPNVLNIEAPLTVR